MTTIDEIISAYKGEEIRNANKKTFSFRIPHELHQLLLQSGTNNRRSFHAEVVYRLAVSLKEHP